MCLFFSCSSQKHTFFKKHIEFTSFGPFCYTTQEAALNKEEPSSFCFVKQAVSPRASLPHLFFSCSTSQNVKNYYSALATVFNLPRRKCFVNDGSSAGYREALRL